MEWVVTTGKTLDEAKDLALDQLGVDEADAEFEVLEEPKPGLFGRLRGEARVRARVRPTQARPKVERKRRKPAGKAEASAEAESGATAADAGSEAPTRTPARAGGGRSPRNGSNGARRAVAKGAAMSDEGDETGPVGDLPSVPDAARTFLTGLTEALGVEASVAVVEAEGDDEFEAQLEGSDLGVLIGPAGQTLAAVQELTRLAVQQARGGVRGGWLRVDVGGYRVKRREALERFTEKVVAEVTSSGQPKALEPMSSADRKIVHDAATRLGGVETSSEGEEPRRRVVIRPA
jgi:spoIIIJ-associated protein